MSGFVDWIAAEADRRDPAESELTVQDRLRRPRRNRFAAHRPLQSASGKTAEA